MKLAVALPTIFSLTSLAVATPLVIQQPVSGGGVSRWSQLWQDPGPNENDLDSDSVCWEDFTLTTAQSINHIEWWGAGACEMGFQIEVWKQDSRTIAYQPMGLFYYGGDHTVQPEVKFRPTNYSTSPGPGGLTHFTLELSTPITLAANNSANARWFIAIIGLTQQPFVTWNWAQGTGGSNRTFQFVRGDHLFRSLPEGRAMVLGVVCPSDFNSDDTVDFFDYLDFVDAFSSGSASADFNDDGVIDFFDYLDFVDSFSSGC